MGLRPTRRAILKRKRGPFSRADVRAITEAIGKGEDVAAIAKRLHRTEETIQAWVEINLDRKPVSGADGRGEILKALRQTRAWHQLREEFDFQEVLVFEEKFVDLVSQFREDVTPTEQTQVFHLIKVELLMSRVLVERKHCRELAERYEKIINKRLKAAAPDGDLAKVPVAEKDILGDFERRIEQARAKEQSRAPEYAKLEEKHQSIIKDLKATRDQRLSRIESGKDTFLGLLRKLSNEDERKRESRQMELMRLAGEREASRLASPTTYADGAVDLPILSADTIGLAAEGDSEDCLVGVNDLSTKA